MRELHLRELLGHVDRKAERVENLRYEEQIRGLARRGLLDEATAQASLDAAPPEYVAPLYAYLVSDLAQGITGQILVGAGGFVGRFDRPSPALLGYRGHTDEPPWTLPELDAMVRR